MVHNMQLTLCKLDEIIRNLGLKCCMLHCAECGMGDKLICIFKKNDHKKLSRC